MKVVAFVLGVFIAAMFFSPLCYAQVPHMIHYQGKITTPQGSLISDTVSMQISIYRDSIGGTSLWTEIQNHVQLDYGIFDILLGTVTPIPDSVFDGNVRYLGLKVRGDPEMSPRKAIASVGYAIRSGNAAKVREIYHQIIDVMPNSSTKFYVVPKNPPTKVTLYLYGEPFAGALLAHTHSGNNAHTHTFSGTTGAESADHTHNLSGNTGFQSADHTHSGTTSSVDLTHSHSGGIGNTDLTHNHTGSTGTAGDHQHWFQFVGVGSTGPYLVHSGQPTTGLSTSPDTPVGFARLSVMNAGAHSHSLSIDNALGVHTHTLSINNSLGLHSHTFTTGGVSTNHYHGFSGTTGGTSANHTHNFSGTTGSSGTGLNQTGVLAGTLPQVVRVYIDGQLAAGPWSGNFVSGPIDLSQYISNANQHTVEIKEEGGSGGRVIYDLYIE